MSIRRTYARIERSGLKSALDKYTFDNFVPKQQWQRDIKTLAKAFVVDHDGKWFYIGGQVGSGKTHICTAIVSELIKQGLEAKYMLWRDETVTLKACISSDDMYSRRIRPFKQADVLYIDDFLKTTVDNTPTAADINIAFEVINYRYNDPAKITIISSEKYSTDLLAIDEAVGSRIYQKAKDYITDIAHDAKRNYRLGAR